LERTETGWGRTAEPTPRWRSLLDRALLGRNGPEDDDYDGRFSEERLAEARESRVTPSYPGDPERRDRHDESPRRGYGDYAIQGRYPAVREGYDEYPPAEEYDEYPARNGYPRRDAGYPVREDYDEGPDYPAPADYRTEKGYPQAAAYAGGAGYAPPAEQGVYAPEYPDETFPTAGAGGYQPVMEWSQEPEDDSEQYAEVLRQELSGPHVLAFANPKGGVHKTTATVLTSAAIGSIRGRGVIAWDDNELRGTLGLRAGSARHARTIRHLVRDIADVEAVSDYELTARLDDYLRHASDGTYDVLAGEENPRFAQRLDPHTVKRVLELLRRTHDVICVDTGNNVESPNWQTVLQAADQLVVTTVPREDAAFTADWMLDLLDEAGMDDMVANAVTLLSCPSPNPTPLIDDLAAHFAARTRAVVVVPYDPALESGSQIEYSDLQPATRRAWLRAAAAMMDPYHRSSTW
jgi:MinD-like ATPase involved in chromosome partitioning or flagellar assembly